MTEETLFQEVLSRCPEERAAFLPGEIEVAAHFRQVRFGDQGALLGRGFQRVAGAGARPGGGIPAPAAGPSSTRRRYGVCAAAGVDGAHRPARTANLAIILCRGRPPARGRT